MKNYLIKLLSLVVLITLFFNSCSNRNKKNPPKVVNGVLDLGIPVGEFVEPWDFDKDGVINLSGDWEFYWQKFCRTFPKDSESQNEKQLDSCTPSDFSNTIPVPGSWNNFKNNEKAIGGEGFATYRLKIKNKKLRNPGLKISNISSNYELYINNKLIYSGGKIGDSYETSLLSSETKIIPIEELDEEIEIRILISNFHFVNGGILNPIVFGQIEDLNLIREKKLSLDFFLFGSLLIMSLYHIGLFILRREVKSTLYFALFCLSLSIRPFFLGEEYLSSHISNTYHEFLYKLELLNLYLVPVFGFLFMYENFKLDFNKIITKVFVCLFLILFLIVLLTPITLFRYTLNPFQFITLFLFIYIMYCIVRATYHKREGSIAFLTGITILIAISINDILHQKGIIYTGYFASLGNFLFVFSQAYMLSAKFSNAFKESIISKRDAEEQKNIAENRKLEIEKLNKAKDEFLANLSHELKTPLTYIYMYAEMLSSPIEAETVIEYGKEVFSNAQKLNDYVEDLILITDIESNIKLNLESISPNVIIEEEVDTINKLTVEKNISIKLNLAQSLNLSIDKNLFTKSIHAVVKNAILYSNENGIVEINSKSDSMNFILSVRDSGMGIAKENQQKIFDKFFRVETSLNYEISGVGVGLFLTKKIVELFKGKVEVISEIGFGSEFIITIPLASNVEIKK